MTLDLGGHLKTVRMMHGLSQRELAKRAGVANSTISLIEQNRVSPSVGSLQRVLDGFPMSLEHFFGLHARVFYRYEELADVRDPRGNGSSAEVSMRMLAAERPNRSMNIVHARFAPGADIGTDASTQRGEEGGFVIRGRIEVTVGSETQVLNSGDAFYFARSVPRRFRNLGSEPCEIVSACTPPEI